MLLKDKKVSVCKFVPRSERIMQQQESIDEFTNVYVKNFADKLNEEMLREMFEVKKSLFAW